MPRSWTPSNILLGRLNLGFLQTQDSAVYTAWAGFAKKHVTNDVIVTDRFDVAAARPTSPLRPTNTTRGRAMTGKQPKPVVSG